VPSTIRFRDGTAASGLDFIHDSGHTPEQFYPNLLGSGVALLDYDGDGRLDIYLASNRNIPLDAPCRSRGNRLYRNRGDGTFDDVTDRAGVGFRGFTHGLAVGDVDNNGFPDLYLTNFGPNVLYLNNGDGTFRNASATSGATVGLWSTGAAFLDYDGDGHLDLYVSCYGHWRFEDKHPFHGDAQRQIHKVVSPTTIPPERHFLFRNRGDGTFEETTASAGILRRDGRGLGVVAADFDRDGHIDLFVANDLCPNFLFRNRGDGTFEDASDTAGAACNEAGETQSGMGVDAEDVNGDGLPEIVVSHFRGEYCTLYRNLDGRNFQDVSASAGIVADSKPYIGWGCALADFDCDGWPDLMVVNGHVDRNLEALGEDLPFEEPARLWRNDGRGRFLPVRDAGPFFQQAHAARGAAFGDLDNDGDLDIVINRIDGPPALLWNESEGGHWIGLGLIGTKSNRSAIGAMVEVHAEGRVLSRQVKGGGSYLSAHDSRLLVGLGAADRVERVVIRWPAGGETVLPDPVLGRYHQVREHAEN
jgi:hypothetical protein